VGQQAPDFELPDQDERLHRSQDYRGRWLVVFFYPKDNTPGCTQEACRFSDDYALFQALNAEVVGVSGDGAQAHQRFALTCRLRYRLLSDRGRALRRAWGVPHILGHLSGRSTFVLDPQGKVGFVYNSRRDAVGHPEKALAFLRSQASA